VPNVSGSVYESGSGTVLAPSIRVITATFWSNANRLTVLQMEGDLLFAPGFVVPPNTDYKSYHKYIDEFLLPESPVLYGLHPNAEIGTLTTRSENLFQTLMEMQPRDAGSSSRTGISRDDKVKRRGCRRLLVPLYRVT